MKSRELYQLGIPRGEPARLAQVAFGKAVQAGKNSKELKGQLVLVANSPAAHTGDELFGELARELLRLEAAQARYRPREKPAPYHQWGENLEAGALEQMHNAVQLPVAVSGALMPDAHQGYGLPIGGVLTTRDCVIPYAVGVDIACRMKLTVLDLPVSTLDDEQERLRNAIERETRFGIGASFRQRHQHDVLDANWSVSEVTRQNRDKAWAQLGSSGSGNHFVEFGELTLWQEDLGLEAGTYLALLSHSGSRGTGASVAAHYSKLAMHLHPELPRELIHLAWLDMDTDEGQAYWNAMNLMGRYAAASHELIHRFIAKHLGAEVMLDIENHHNFAWKETHGGEELIVHRKGATPAGDGVMGIIPGSMGDPGFVVRGKGKTESLRSASHGAGRRMSRTAAKKEFTWEQTRAYLAERKVSLISAGLDEAPMAYKNIHEVMAQQEDLVDVAARFDPRLVKMAKAGERPED